MKLGELGEDLDEESPGETLYNRIVREFGRLGTIEKLRLVNAFKQRVRFKRLPDEHRKLFERCAR